MTRILVLEEVSAAGLDFLRAEPEFEVQEIYEDNPARIRAGLSEADALIIRSKTKVGVDFLAFAPQLKLIGRPGTGVDNVDVPAATRRGIVVMNTPAGNSISAAEHACGLLLSLARNIPQADASMKQGKWERQKFLGTELHDKVLGVVGFGKIGSEVVKRASGFGMRVLVFDPYLPEALAREQDIELVPLEALLAQSDFITLHAPLTASTRKMIDPAAFAKMKTGVYLVNAARGELIDEEALLAALNSGKVSGAALDVFSNEPRPNAALVGRPDVITTPHIGASTVEAQEKVGYDIAVQIRDYFKDGIVRNAVNFPSISLTEYKRVAPYLQLGERLGSFASQVSQGRMQELSVRYYGELSGMDTHLIGASILVGVLKPILTERVTLVNALQTARERGVHFVETRSSRERSYSNLISVKLLTDQGEEWLEGTVLHQNHLHITSLYGIDIDAPLGGDLLVIRNNDTPGVIGRVGTILGDHGINIANFALGRSEDASGAVGLVNVDSEITDSVLREISVLPQVRRAQLVRLTP